MKASLPSWLSSAVVILLAPLFFLGGPDFYSPEAVKSLWNFGHIIFFSILLLLVQSFKPLTHWRQWLLVSAIALVLGVGIESIQYFVGRNSSWSDLLHNLFGVWIGLFWGQKPTLQIWCLRLASLWCVLPSAWIVIDSVWVDQEMRKQFPLINSFELRPEIQQVRANVKREKIQKVSDIALHGSYSLAVHLTTQKYSGIRLVGPYGDWSPYQFLVMDFYNPDDEPFVLVLKISDYQHDIGSNQYADRFNRVVTLHTGWNEVRINMDDIRNAPAEREMQLEKMTGLGVFAVKLPKPRTFYWDNVRLE